MPSAEGSLSWRTSFYETISALAAVVVGDLVSGLSANVTEYTIALVATFIVGLIPMIILVALRKRDSLSHYKRFVSRFGIWLAAILAANMFASGWAIFKIEALPGVLAMGLFFVLVLLANRILNPIVGSLGKDTFDFFQV